MLTGSAPSPPTIPTPAPAAAPAATDRRPGGASSPSSGAIWSLAPTSAPEYGSCVADVSTTEGSVLQIVVLGTGAGEVAVLTAPAQRTGLARRDEAGTCRGR